MNTLLMLLVVAMAIVTSECVHLNSNSLYGNCGDLHCVNPEKTTGRPCQLTCPQGPTCYHPETRQVLRAGTTYDIDNKKCRCSPTESYLDKFLYPNWEIAYCE